jgi:Fe2+ or Zn2+ uptake regulation protein
MSAMKPRSETDLSWSNLSDVCRELVKAIGTMEREGRIPTGAALADEVRLHADADISDPTVYRHLKTLQRVDVVETTRVDDRAKRHDLSDRGKSILKAEAVEICYAADLSLDDGRADE